jgi:hypothetical protein
MVVSEASTSPATFSRTVPSLPKQRTEIRPPSAPFTSECAPRIRPPGGKGASGRTSVRSSRSAIAGVRAGSARLLASLWRAIGAISIH